MTTSTQAFVRVAGMAALVACATGLAARGPALRPAAELIRSAVLDRVGASAEVSLTGLDVPGPAATFRSARPDPAGRAANRCGSR